MSNRSQATVCLAALFSLALPLPAAAQRAGLYLPGQNTSLKLVRYDVDVDVQHPVAHVTVTQAFENPLRFQQEAYFYYALPPAATLHDLALWVHGERRPARVLERQKAREIYNGIVRQKRDPALVERLRGNLFRIRIFPVLPGVRTRVELSFVQPIEHRAAGRYALRLRRPPGPKIDVLRLTVRMVGAKRAQSLRLEGHGGLLRPSASGEILPRAATQRSFDHDIVLHYALPVHKHSAVAALSADGRYFVAELPRPLERARSRLSLLIDTSASMAKHLPRLRQLAQSVIEALPPGASLQLLPFDYLPRPSAELGLTHHPATASLRQRAYGVLKELTAKRGSSFAPAVEQALAAGANHVLLLTDGASARHQAELEHLLRRLHDRSASSSAAVSVVLLEPGAASAELLRDLTRASGGSYVEAPAADASVLARLAKLAPSPRPRAKLSSLEVLRSAPDHLLVAGQLPTGDRARSLKISVTPSHQVSLELPAVGHGSAPRALWAASRIETLYRRIKLFGAEEALRRRIVELSQRHRVVSEYTAFLVTETDADYDRKTSGRTWQRRVSRLGDARAPSFHSTPEPHEWALIGLGLLLVAWARRRSRLAPELGPTV